MKHGFVFLAIAISGFSSCSTYRAGQTPDDVYYSPGRETYTYVQTNQDEENRTTYNQQDLEDQRLRQQIRDQRFRNFDDDFYWNSPYTNPSMRFNTWNNWNNWNSPWAMNSFGWGNGWNTWNLGWNSWSTWNNPWGWNSWNSPFVCVPGTAIIIPGPGAPRNSTGIRYSPGIQNYNNAGPRTGFGGKGGYTNGNTNGGSRYFGGASNNNGGRRSGSFFNDFFGGGNNNSGRSFNTGSGNRSFGNEGGFGGGNRSFGSGGSSGGSGGGGSRSGGSSGGTGGRRN